jgi:apolipoprotein N-acyltransferase
VAQTPPRISRIAHWVGIALAAPLFCIGIYLLHQYWNGAFGNEVTGKDTAAVVGFIFISTAAVYLAMRWAGFLLAQAIDAFRKIGKGNGTSFGSRPPRPE